MTQYGFSKMQEGSRGTFYAILSEHKVLESRGKQRDVCKLSDALGTVDAVSWDLCISNSVMSEFVTTDNIVEVDGVMGSYNGKPQITIKGLMEADEDVDVSRLVARAETDPEAVEDVFRWAKSALAEFEHDALLTTSKSQSTALPICSLWDLFFEKRRDDFFSWPAATYHHHATHGGLAVHTAEMLSMYLGMMKSCANFPSLQSDPLVVLTGILYHDVGKLIELGPITSPGYTRTGSMIGHIGLGLMEFTDDTQRIRYANGCSMYRSSFYYEVSHVIASHHGENLEWGSMVKPKTMEADVVHQLDLMSCRTMSAHLSRSNKLGHGPRLPEG
jgi:3'-5' exoribonuclease